MGTDPNILPGLTLSGLSESIKKCLSSEEFDPRGERGNMPVFDRAEPDITRKLSLLMRKHLPEMKIDVEYPYPHSRKRCDIVITHPSKQQLWIEAKSSWEKQCTGWENLSKQRDGCIHDIEKLRSLPDIGQKIFFLLAFWPKADEFPKEIAPEIRRHIGSDPIWSTFDLRAIPTETRKPCITPCTCHILLWLVADDHDRRIPDNSQVTTDVTKHSFHREGTTMAVYESEGQKKECVRAVHDCIKEIAKQSKDSFTISCLYDAPKKRYHGGYISYAKTPWVLYCWAEESENSCGMPYWIELDEGAVKHLEASGKSGSYSLIDHPSKPGRKVKPVSVEEMANSDKVAQMVLEIARLSLKKSFR